VIVRADSHDHWVLPTRTPTGNRALWDELPWLPAALESVVERIQFLASHDLSSMMVLSIFVSRHITPLQSCVRPTWLYTGEGDATRLEREQGSNLASDEQRALLGKLSPDPASTGFTTLPPAYAPLCSDQATRRRLLQELSTLDDISLAVRQKGD
jgi:hypothetical protein